MSSSSFQTPMMSEPREEIERFKSDTVRCRMTKRRKFIADEDNSEQFKFAPSYSPATTSSLSSLSSSISAPIKFIEQPRNVKRNATTLRRTTVTRADDNVNDIAEGDSTDGNGMMTAIALLIMLSVVFFTVLLGTLWMVGGPTALESWMQAETQDYCRFKLHQNECDVSILYPRSTFKYARPASAAPNGEDGSVTKQAAADASRYLASMDILPLTAAAPRHEAEAEAEAKAKAGGKQRQQLQQQAQQQQQDGNRLFHEGQGEHKSGHLIKRCLDWEVCALRPDSGTWVLYLEYVGDMTAWCVGDAAMTLVRVVTPKSVGDAVAAWMASMFPKQALRRAFWMEKVVRGGARAELMGRWVWDGVFDRIVNMMAVFKH